MHCCTLLENNHFPICRCGCGDIVLENGVYSLSYIYSAGRNPKHCDLNNIIWRSLNTVLEPPGLCRNDNKRVDGITLTP